jgi:hypothetical protein
MRCIEENDKDEGWYCSMSRRREKPTKKPLKQQAKRRHRFGCGVMGGDLRTKLTVDSRKGQETHCG